jgi:nucleotide-binding universal stress UspA family protein
MDFGPFKRIALAFAFSPRREALLAEAKRVVDLQNAELFIIHVGERKEHKDSQLDNLVEKLNFNPERTHICWETGDPAVRILEVCQEKQIDLLIAGAMRQRNLLQYYLGSVARKILRNAACSVLVLTEPSKQPQRVKDIVVCIDENPRAKMLLEQAIGVGRRHATRQVHILKQAIQNSKVWPELVRPESPRQFVEHEIIKVHKILQRINTTGVAYHIKITATDPMQALPAYVKRYNADLLILPTPSHRFMFLHRLFRRELELLFSDLPCNLLLIKNSGSNR